MASAATSLPRPPRSPCVTRLRAQGALLLVVGPWAAEARAGPAILPGPDSGAATPMSITPQAALQRTIEHREIFHDEMVGLMRQIMGGQVSPVMAAAILSGLRVKKETVGEIAGAAVAMREFSRP